MKKQILSVSLLTALAIGAAAETPLWLRDVAISPDGSTVAFTYKGDIYTVASAGGHALQITSDRNYDASPVWRPDGRQIVFRSNREGSDDLYVVDAKGGTPRRLTTHSGSERPLAFLNDSVVLFSANIHPSMQAIQGPFQAQTYAINIDRPSARPSMWLSMPVMAADADAAGRVIYQDRKGYEDPLRKHERSSGTADIWLMENGRFTKLTDFNGHSLNPLWKPGSTDTFYFVSEEDGTLNVYERSVDGKNKRQLTKFDRHPVRSLSASDNGMLAFSWNGEIYTMKPGSEPAKLNIEIVADNYDADAVKYYTGSGVSRFTPSPDGEEVAFVIRGDVYVTNTKYKTTRRITNTPAQERNVSFSPDGRSLVYDSDRDRQWQLFTAKIKDPSQKQFAYATDIVEEPLYSCATSAQQPAFSPDGKKVAFLENRNELRVIDLDSRKVTTALEGRFNYSYSDGDI
ncbi:MAG: peptidase S41, partial [Paramuribaculum sp.]|nr:peptidase S41 [Paramuribaculum sp.]